MSVWLYKGGFHIVEKSGVGRAICHQEEMLARAGIPQERYSQARAGVVHINTVFPDSVIAARAARLQGKRVVYYAHSTEEDFRNSFCGSNLFSPLFRRWIKYCYSLGDVVLTPTEYAKKLLQSYGIQRPVYAISNGIDTGYFTPDAARGQAFRRRYGLTEKDRVVISAGHYIERKGILDFIELAKKMPQVRFLWFGHTDPRLIPTAVRQAIKTAPPNLMFPGFVDRSAMRDAYCGADAFVFLSREETEGIVVLEALACGVPVVLRDIPVYDGWLTAGRDVYKVSGPARTEETVAKLLAGQLPDLTAAGRSVAESRSFARVGERLREIYRAEGLLTAAAEPASACGMRGEQAIL